MKRSIVCSNLKYSIILSLSYMLTSLINFLNHLPYYCAGGACAMAQVEVRREPVLSFQVYVSYRETASTHPLSHL